MLKKINHEFKYHYDKYRLFVDEKDTILHFPVLPGVVQNVATKKESQAFDFLIDSGASISILNAKFHDLFADTKHDKKIIITYGANREKELPVYQAKIFIQGAEYNILVGLDDQLSFRFSILGTYTFLEKFDSVVLNYKKRQTKLIYLKEHL